jgi:hypothetical protein
LRHTSHIVPPAWCISTDSSDSSVPTDSPRSTEWSE